MNREKHNAYQRAWRNRNKDKVRAYMKDWKRSNPEKVLEQKNGWRFGGNREAALIRDNYTCQSCGMTDKEHRARWGRSISVDHTDGLGRYKPTSKRNDAVENLITLCLKCHGSKDGRRAWTSYFRKKHRLVVKNQPRKNGKFIKEGK